MSIHKKNNHSSCKMWLFLFVILLSIFVITTCARQVMAMIPSNFELIEYKPVYQGDPVREEFVREIERAINDYDILSLKYIRNGKQLHQKIIQLLNERISSNKRAIICIPIFAFTKNVWLEFEDVLEDEKKLAVKLVLYGEEKIAFFMFTLL